MGFKKNLFYKLFSGFLACTFAFAPLNTFAAEDTVTAQMQAAYSKAIDSNAWENWPTGPSVYAESAIVMEADTGAILYAKDIDAKRYPASITKIMTALVVLEQCEDLNEQMEYSYHATHSIEYGSSSIARTEGEILTVEESLYGLLLESANECANALAEHFAGSTEEFAVLMNQKAAELGCTNTNFVNPHGLHNENHYTSAHDMALITRAAIANDDFRRICGQKRYELRATNKNDEMLTMYNHHLMISNNRTSKYLDDTVFAGKTGYTSDALNTLMTCAARNDMDIIVITMRAHSTGERGVPVFTDTAALLDYAGNFQKLGIAANEQTFEVGNAYDFTVESEELNASLISIDENSNIILPNTVSFADAKPSITFEELPEGRQAYLTYEYAGQTVGSAPITLAENEKEEFSFADTESGTNENDSKERPHFITINLKVIAILFAVLLVLLVIAYFVYNFYTKNRAKIQKAIRIYKKRQFLKKKRSRRRRRK